MLETVRFLALAVLPAVVALALLRYTDRTREPLWLVSATFALGIILGGGALRLESWLSSWTGMTIEARVAGEGPALVFLFAAVAPLREAAKVAACWPAFRSRHFDEPYDGVVYSGAAALGFACVENAVAIHAHPHGWASAARALLSLPAHLFFAWMWGYALGRARQSKSPGASFPLLFTVALVGHGLYVHIVYGRPVGALVATLPLLVAMGVTSYLMGRDLASRPPQSIAFVRLSNASIDALVAPSSLSRVRDAIRREEKRVRFGWVGFGALVTLGAMLLGVGGAVALAHVAHVDFSIVDEHDVTTTAPVALLGAGLLAAFPLAGFLMTRASAATSLVEPSLSAMLALALLLALLGWVAPVALVFALALAPIAFGLACAGAWVGRP